MTLTASGGGRGGHTTYWYQFYGSFTGTITANGITQAVNGSVSQVVRNGTQVGPAGIPVTGGSLGWNSAYSPLIVSDNANTRLVSADNITGANYQTYGSYGSGTGQFNSISGLAQDSSGRIYVTDSILNRISRIDNLTGKNWVELGGLGSGVHQFHGPMGVTIDTSQKIWIADAANHRIVRFDDMIGANWVSFGAFGSGPKQFSAPSSIAFDAKGRIYVADTGNNRIVRFDDLTGTNWTQLTQISLPPYAYNVTSPVGIAVNSAGQIYIALSNGFMLRVSDMTGANGSVAPWGTGIYSISLDKSGTLFVTSALAPRLGQALDAIGTGYFASALNGAVQQPGVVLATLSSSPTPADPVLSTQALAFGSRNVGEPTTAQKVVVTNIGARPLTITLPTTLSDYKVASGCAAQLGGSSCAINVQFDPSVTGSRPATLSIASNGVHRGLGVALSGFGTVPHAVVLPGTLNFDSQKTGTASGTQTVTLSNTGTGPLTISSIAASGDFTQTNNCGAQLIPGNGCTLLVSFHPLATGTRAGSLTISDDAIPTGTKQTVALQGTGAATAPAFTLVPESLQFPDQQIKTTSAAQAVTLTNTSGNKVLLGTSAYSSTFTGKTTCGTSLAAGASCMFNVQFSPIALGPATGSLTIPIPGHPSLTVGLSGTGSPATTSPALSVNPNALNFGQQVYGDSTTLSMTVSNTSGLPIGIAPISVSGDPSFSIGANTCPAILAGYASCSLQVTFLPSATDPYARATLTVAERSGAKTLVSVSGQAGSDNGN